MPQEMDGDVISIEGANVLCKFTARDGSSQRGYLRRSYFSWELRAGEQFSALFDDAGRAVSIIRTGIE